MNYDFSDNAPLGAGGQNSETKSEIIQKYAVYTMLFLISPPRSRCPEISEKHSGPDARHGAWKVRKAWHTQHFFDFFLKCPLQSPRGWGVRGAGRSEFRKIRKIIQKYAVYTMVFLIFQPLERGFGISEKK